MASKHRTLHDLLLHHLRDLYCAERHLGKMLAKMARSATSDRVREALETRQDQTAVRLEALEAIFDLLDRRAHGGVCDAMHGLIEDTKSLIDDFDGTAALDAGLLAAAQAIDHFILARYGAVRLWAGKLALTGILGPVDLILAEGRQALAVWASLAGTVPVDAAPSPAASITLKQAALLGLG